jgi:hypothetical protein
MKKINYKTLSNNDLGNIYHLTKKCIFAKSSIKKDYILLSVSNSSGAMTWLFTNPAIKGDDIPITAKNAKKYNIWQ